MDIDQLHMALTLLEGAIDDFTNGDIEDSEAAVMEATDILSRECFMLSQG